MLAYSDAIDFECSECFAPVQLRMENRQRGVRSSLTALVQPCAKCLKELEEKTRREERENAE